MNNYKTESPKTLTPIYFFVDDIDIRAVISASYMKWIKLKNLSNIGNDTLNNSSLYEDQNGNYYWKKRNPKGSELFIHFVPRIRAAS